MVENGPRVYKTDRTIYQPGYRQAKVSGGETTCDQADIMKSYLDYNDIDLLENAANCQRDRLLIRLLSRLGCRISEALAIKVDDIDFEEGTVIILHLKRNARLSCSSCKARMGGRHQFCPGCGTRVKETVKIEREKRRVRVLPIDNDTLTMAKTYLSQNGLSPTDGPTPLFRLNRHRAW